MDDNTTPKKTISAHDVLRTELIINQALIDLLIDKQIITTEELVDCIQNIKRDQKKLHKSPSNIVPFKRKK
jgi:predicted transcriptional regulator